LVKTKKLEATRPKKFGEVKNGVEIRKKENHSIVSKTEWFF
jgi:hypothetical protein